MCIRDRSMPFLPVNAFAHPLLAITALKLPFESDSFVIIRGAAITLFRVKTPAVESSCASVTIIASPFFPCFIPCAFMPFTEQIPPLIFFMLIPPIQKDPLLYRFLQLFPQVYHFQ